MSPTAFALPRPRSSARRIAGHVRRLVMLLELVLQVRRERRMLSGMDDRALADVGFDRGRAHAEAGRSFWDLPVDRLHA
jgi:uncharacterized protein YjiS (DUF1127 family)